jgi:hypothetical protein
MTRVGAVTGAAVLVKTGQALGIASSLARASATPAPACGTNGFVKFTSALNWDPGPEDGPQPPTYGSVSLWYSGTCRSVAAQISVPHPIPDQKLFTDVGLHKQGTDPSTDIDLVCNPGSNGCKTRFYNDADIQQQAFASTWTSTAILYDGRTPYW